MPRHWRWKLRVPEVETMGEVFRMVEARKLVTGHISGRHPAHAFDIFELCVQGNEVIQKVKRDVELTAANLEVQTTRTNGTVPDLSIIVLRHHQTLQAYPAEVVSEDSDLYGAMRWLAERMEVSPLWFNGPFLYCLNALIAPVEDGGPIPPFIPPSGESTDGETTSAASSNKSSITGLYGTGDWASVWFSHNMSTGRSTYVIDNLNDMMLARLTDLVKETRAPRTGLLRFMSVDALVCNDCPLMSFHDKTYYDFMGALKSLDNPRMKGSSDASTERYVQLDELYMRMEHQSCDYQHHARALTLVQQVIQVRRAYLPRYRLEGGEYTLASAQQAINCVRASSQVMSTIIEHRLGYFQGRTNIHMSILMQRDSASMITIAFMTMIFLPGSLVAALFSTVFVDSNSKGAGVDDNKLILSPKIWVYFAITIPLTLFVFALWFVWRNGARNWFAKWRNKVKHPFRRAAPPTSILPTHMELQPHGP